MKANSEAAKKRLARLNNEFLLRQKVHQLARSKSKGPDETFGQAVARVAKESQIIL